ncbi:hypothetical protein EV424DRAFT_1538692 [Suillus variegatus]|nr:hypothetical protein EV424DRAFT_1538692 [Suillus variegatus]
MESSAPRGHFVRRHAGHRGRGQLPPLDQPNSDALNAFTQFFVAEAQAKELATWKEAHAFEQRIHSERYCNRDSHSRYHGQDRESERHRMREACHFADRPVPPSLHRTLDNCRSRRPNPPRAQPLGVPHPIVPRAQSLEVPESPSMSITPPPSLPSPSPVPSPAEPAGDLGANIDSLIAESEQMDLEAEARCHGFTAEELFGSVILLGLITIVNVSLLILLAAMGTMNLETAHSSQA